MALVGRSPQVAKVWGGRLGLVFIDGGHTDEHATADYEGWAPHVADGGLLLIHDVFPVKRTTSGRDRPRTACTSGHSRPGRSPRSRCATRCASCAERARGSEGAVRLAWCRTTVRIPMALMTTTTTSRTPHVRLNWRPMLIASPRSSRRALAAWLIWQVVSGPAESEPPKVLLGPRSVVDVVGGVGRRRRTRRSRARRRARRSRPRLAVEVRAEEVVEARGGGSGTARGQGRRHRPGSQSG